LALCPHTDVEASKMLRDARMADLRKLRRGIGHIGKGGSGQKNGV